MAAGISDIAYNHIDELKIQVSTVVSELLDIARLEAGDIFVIGCSSSEVAHQTIGTFSSAEIGETIFKTANDILSAKGIYLAAQCCEHLNRALIVEKEAARLYRIPVVNVMPQLKAGGSFATAAYYGFKNPVAVENIQAQAGIDIGDTLIGMHLAPVAVPVRVSLSSIGDAHVVCARTRAKYIGGERAAYNKTLA